MTYVALLRGINVGGKSMIEMAKLKLTFERLGFEQVKTFINSGNVVFVADTADYEALPQQIEVAISKDFNLDVKVVLRDLPSIEKLLRAIPDAWVNDQTTKCDVLFLWEGVDRPDILKQFSINSKIEDVRYFPGAVVWRIDRKNQGKSRMTKIVGTDLYKQITIRNPNTVRKLYALMQAAALA